MTTTILTAYRNSSISIRLIEIQDSGYALVNDHHFALQVGRPIDISAALNQTFNTLQLFVHNSGLIIGGHWNGRFELYVNGRLIGAYANEGTDIRTNQDHLVAQIELQLVEQSKPDSEPDVSRITHKLQLTSGMTNADKKDFPKSHPFIKFQNGVTIYVYKNVVGVDHVFVTDHTGTCVFGGYVGWMQAARLQEVLEGIRQEYSPYLI